MDKEYTQKEKMHYYAQRSRKGAKKANGEPLSDFDRGRSFERSEQLGRQLGRYKYNQAKASGDTATMESMKATRAEIKAKKAFDRANYLKQKAEKKGKKK